MTFNTGPGLQVIYLWSRSCILGINQGLWCLIVIEMKYLIPSVFILKLN